jgi:hypothetical protein
VAGRFADLLRDSQVSVTHIKGRRGRIYRSRLVGLTETEARRACKTLKASKIDCLVVQVGSKTAAKAAARQVASN